jgi:hypothetical protein
MNTNAELDNTNNPGVVPDKILQKALMALLQCSSSDLESYHYKMIDGYTDDVKRVLNAVGYEPPESQAKQIEELKSAEKTLKQMGYTNEGGEYWKPPLAKAPDFDLVDSLHMQIEAIKADADRIEWLAESNCHVGPELELEDGYGLAFLDNWNFGDAAILRHNIDAARNLRSKA